jgi:Methyltransferase domain
MKASGDIQRAGSGHIIPKEKAGYNERLFRSGIRKNYHEARFHWLRHQLQQRQITTGTFLELGCFDGRSISFLPFQPKQYLGYDANWENGLEIAKQQRGQYPTIKFRNCQSAADFDPPLKSFDFGICLETLEHLPEAELPLYLQAMQQAVRQKIFVTVPVETGPLAVLKYLYKRIFLAVDEPYSTAELWHLCWGHTHKIARVPFGHKGFDYRVLKKTLQQYFHIEKVHGLPFKALPPGLNLSCGFVLAPLN